MNNSQFPLYLTTAIAYVNAAPHIGHALELVIADALARHHRQRGREVLLTSGTDDHSSKNARAAERLGIPTTELVARNGSRFRRLGPELGVRFDDYLHTASDPRHAPAVYELWKRCAEAGDLYQSEYTGSYCTGCEAFLKSDEQRDGACPHHREPLELVSETNWFFRLSRYQEPLLEALESNRLQISPPERRNEVLQFVRAGLVDFSVSRNRRRARDWGLGVPGDSEQVIYVWFDALANYLSLLGFPQATPRLAQFWADTGAAREHLIGKDILRFHAVYWPALLLSAGLPLPSAIRTHGFVTINGKKISKTLGNVVDPFALVSEYGSDPVRYYLLRHLHTTKDSDFRIERLVEAHDSELAGKLGNLLQRTTALALHHPELELQPWPEQRGEQELELELAADDAARALTSAFEHFALHDALAQCFELVSAANRYADRKAPWTLSRRLRTGDTEWAKELSHVLWCLCEVQRIIAVLIEPFLPETARAIVVALGLEPCALESLGAAHFDAKTRFAPRAVPPLFPRRKARGSNGDFGLNDS